MKFIRWISGFFLLAALILLLFKATNFIIYSLFFLGVIFFIIDIFMFKQEKE